MPKKTAGKAVAKVAKKKTVAKREAEAVTARKPSDIAHARPPKKRGPPRFQPTDDERRLVQTLAGYGCTLRQIAVLVRDGIDKDICARDFRRELELGRARALAKIEETLYQKALGGDFAAMRLYLVNRSQGNWQEAHKMEISNPDGSMRPPPAVIQLVAVSPNGPSSAD